MDQLTPLQASVLALVKQYVARQSLVLDAMRELRPDIIVMVESPRDITLLVEAATKASKESIGYWGSEQEWEYFLHGSGCRLVHKVTGERLEWDYGDVSQLYVDWFVNYLQWLLTRVGDNEDTKIVRSLFQNIEIIDKHVIEQAIKKHMQWREQIIPILEQLYEIGLLTKSRADHYTVLSNAP